MLKETYFLFKRKIMATLRQPIWIVMSLTTPILYIALFAPLTRNVGGVTLSIPEVLNGFVPGILTLLAFSAGLSGGWDMIVDLKAGVVERFRVTSAKRFSMLLGSILHDIVMFIVPATVLVGISLCFGFTTHWGGFAVLLGMLCLLTAIFSAFSAAIALIVKEMGGLAAVMTGIQLPLMLLSGMLLPLSLGPRWLEILGHFNPLYYTVEASRLLSSGTILANGVYIAFAVVIPLTLLTMWWATRVFRKAVK